MSTKQRAFYFDQSLCLGCDACIAACRAWRDTDRNAPELRVRKTSESGVFPVIELSHFISTCFHCENPSCITICPAKAITRRDEDGVVLVDMEKCLGPEACGHPCASTCPAGVDATGFIERLREGDYKGAWRVLVESNPLASVTGRVCFHPCESACTRGQVDEAVAIHNLERFIADNSIRALPPAAPRRAEKVAIVGSGPAGLSCAYYLARHGYGVTVFEAMPAAGGMLRAGIPAFRLDKAVLDRDIAFIKANGVEIKTSVRLGFDISFADLDKFDAVFLALGATRDRTPRIPGIDMRGVYHGLDFLRKANLGENPPVGRTVLVIGGGNVAIDCARTALRLGAGRVTVACLESREQMPADSEQVIEAEEEGIVICPSRGFSCVLGGNAPTGVECRHLRSMRFDRKGQLHIDAVPSSEHVLPADTVIVATGQGTDLAGLPADVSLTAAGTIKVNRNFETTRRNYFAGGDAAVGVEKRRVAWAIGMGRRAALAIDRRLRGQPLGKTDKVVAGEFQLTDVSHITKAPRVVAAKLAAGQRKAVFGEVEQGLTAEAAAAEVRRCLTCRGMCHIACAYGAPQFITRVKTHMNKCDFCVDRLEAGKEPACVAACPVMALDCGPLSELTARYGAGREAQGFKDSPVSKPSIVLVSKLDSRK